ncbi:MAG: type I-C CRISPR-associated protein Cas7/Csd2 [Opitutus sp.]|nr:type I-C CRISPR-associated protein Cas7/Csd2 [Opitutus sp.]MCS6247503.1 type I-C CRISPR-associated protein Cas7/Csd2 [Opitutus sp.]MCS6273883.1 type I-C CRISPR-associated protein Cas7/Csd2 [Opitutus sp.]MCS6278231.1 type I-C CRISPR-associated protein Cas7/Csd2 [Opitutus sp.]MCS6299341.1 type I-C CRISPR-associated protein Cas7/Csd2 [Opitutus sp.]
MSSSILTNRHDFLLLFEVTNGNPNGDPDAGNMPRLDPNTNRGLVTDVCLKRKVRNFLELFPATRDSATDNGFNILIKQGAVIETEQKKGELAAAESLPKDASDSKKAEAAKNWLCREFFDVRTFGGVISTGDGVLKGSAFGQVRGPVQFTFGQSLHPITPLEVTITRCAVTKEEDAKKERTMGNKHIVPYGLYAAKGYVSPAFAEKTGFTQADLDVLFQALLSMFEHDRSAARGEMIVRGLYDFEHVGTQHANNADQNRREARLGCAHAHKLIEGVQVSLSDEAKASGKCFPESFADYSVVNTWTTDNLPKGVKLHLRHEGQDIAIGPRQS